MSKKTSKHRLLASMRIAVLKKKILDENLDDKKKVEVKACAVWMPTKRVPSGKKK